MFFTDRVSLAPIFLACSVQIYRASKAAVIAMAKSLAKDLAAYVIRVNAVAPECRGKQERRLYD